MEHSDGSSHFLNRYSYSVSIFFVFFFVSIDCVWIITFYHLTLMLCHQCPNPIYRFASIALYYLPVSLQCSVFPISFLCLYNILLFSVPYLCSFIFFIPVFHFFLPDLYIFEYIDVTGNILNLFFLRLKSNSLLLLHPRLITV